METGGAYPFGLRIGWSSPESTLLKLTLDRHLEATMLKLKIQQECLQEMDQKKQGLFSEQTADASIDIFNISSLNEEDQARGKYQAVFDESVLEGRFQVQPCEGVYLFAGMQE